MDPAGFFSFVDRLYQSTRHRNQRQEYIYIYIYIYCRVALGELHVVGLVNTEPLPSSMTMDHLRCLVKLRNGLVRIFSKFNFITVCKIRGLLVFVFHYFSLICATLLKVKNMFTHISDF